MKLFARLVTAYFAVFGSVDEGPVSSRDSLQFVTANWAIKPKHHFTIEWEGHDGPVDINLVGSESNQGPWKIVKQLSTDNVESSLVWRTPVHLPPGNYKIEVVDSKDKSRRDVSPRLMLENRQGAAGSDFSSLVSATAPGASLTATGATLTTSSAGLSSSATTAGGGTSSSATGTGTARASSSITPTSTSTPNTESPSSGLSSGAAAGIGVSCTLGTIVIGVGIWLAIQRAYRKGRESAAPTDHNANEVEQGELHGESKPPPHPLELHSQGVYPELSAAHYWQGQYYDIELPDQSAVPELPTSPHQRYPPPAHLSPPPHQQWQAQSHGTTQPSPGPYSGQHSPQSQTVVGSEYSHVQSDASRGPG
ncbi:hypothetical protein BJ170DRAFT_677284 [Xylariales sp. AK1849]|nr:hypothetical protein BJ170DRAFT_677284 [Xylariales sp. AK1849]